MTTRNRTHRIIYWSRVHHNSLTRRSLTGEASIEDFRSSIATAAHRNEIPQHANTPGHVQILQHFRYCGTWFIENMKRCNRYETKCEKLNSKLFWKFQIDSLSTRTERWVGMHMSLCVWLLSLIFRNGLIISFIWNANSEIVAPNSENILRWKTNMKSYTLLCIECAVHFADGSRSRALILTARRGFIYKFQRCANESASVVNGCLMILKIITIQRYILASLLFTQSQQQQMVLYGGASGAAECENKKKEKMNAAVIWFMMGNRQFYFRDCICCCCELVREPHK